MAIAVLEPGKRIAYFGVRPMMFLLDLIVTPSIMFAAQNQARGIRRAFELLRV